MISNHKNFIMATLMSCYFRQFATVVLDLVFFCLLHRTTTLYDPHIGTGVL